MAMKDASVRAERNKYIAFPGGRISTTIVFWVLLEAILA